MVTTNITEGHAKEAQHNISSLEKTTAEIMKRLGELLKQLGSRDPKEQFLQAAAEFLKEAQAFLKEAQAMLRDMKEFQQQGGEVSKAGVDPTPTGTPGNRVDPERFADALKRFGSQIESVPDTDFVMINRQVTEGFLKEAIHHVQSMQSAIQRSQQMQQGQAESRSESSRDRSPQEQTEPEGDVSKSFTASVTQPNQPIEAQTSMQWEEREIGAPYYQLIDKQSFQPPETLEEWQEATAHDPGLDLWEGLPESEPVQEVASSSPATSQVSPDNYKQYLQSEFEQAIQSAEAAFTVESAVVETTAENPEIVPIPSAVEPSSTEDRETVTETDREITVQAARPPEPVTDYLPPAQVEVTTELEVGELDGGVHQEVLRDGPDIPVIRNADGKVLATPATRDAVEAAEDTAVLDQELSQQGYASAEDLQLNEKAAGAIDFFQAEFEAEGADRLEGDYGYSIERLAEGGGVLFIPDDQPDYPIWVQNNEIQSPITQERLHEFHTYLEGTYDRISEQTISVEHER